MAGAFLGSAIYHVPVVIDGVIAAAAAAAAGRIAPAATDYMLAAHVSAEPASIWLLDLIGVTPAIQAGLRLGEGTGALALFPTAGYGAVHLPGYGYVCGDGNRGI